MSKPPFRVAPRCHTRMTDDSQLTFGLPSVTRKEPTAAFDGGRLSSDGGVMFLALADRAAKSPIRLPRTLLTGGNLRTSGTRSPMC